MNEFNFNIQLFAEIINLTEMSDQYLVPQNSDQIVYTKGGNDSISLASYIYLKIFLDTGEHDDYVYIYWTSGTINGCEDNDYIYNYKGWGSLNGGACNDTISNYGDIDYSSSPGLGRTTINSGSGDDYISVGNTSNIICEYNSCDGNDAIKSDNRYSTVNMHISGEKYSTVKNNDDLIVNVGKDQFCCKATQILLSKLTAFWQVAALIQCLMKLYRQKFCMLEFQ